MLEKRSNKISEAFKNWEMEKDKIAAYFRNRDKEAAAEPMKKFIHSFIELLFLINNTSFKTDEKVVDKIAEFVVKPINLRERISFLLERPVHYHSLIQLTELYEELEKLYQKQLAMKKTRKPE